MQVRTIEELLADFDRLPASYRAVVRDCAYNINTAGLTMLGLSELRRRLEHVQNETIAQVWGREHPQFRP